MPPDTDPASAARPLPTRDQILAQVQANAETIARAYRGRVEAAEKLPDPLRFERLAKIQRVVRDQTNAINRPLVDLLMSLPCGPIVLPVAILETPRAE